MKKNCYRILVFFLTSGLTFLSYWAATDAGSQQKPDLQVVPNIIVLSPSLLREPIQFKGSGFAANEMVVVEMEVPPGTKVKGMAEDEKLGGISYGVCDGDGNFQAALAPTAILNWFLGVEWEPTMKPDLKKLSPLPPGAYKILATGVTSEVVTSAELVIPPPQNGKSNGR